MSYLGRLTRYDKINYAKRTARRVAGTPAPRSDRVGSASRTSQAGACCPLEYPRLAVACTKGWSTIPPSGVERFQPHRAWATDSRRASHPTSRMGRGKWRVLHVPHGRARYFDAAFHRSAQLFAFTSALNFSASSRSFDLTPACFRTRQPRKDHRGVDLISDALPFGRLWYGEPNAIRTMYLAM